MKYMLMFFCFFSLLGCFNSWQENGGAFTINIGGENSRAALAWDPDTNSDDLTHTIIVTDSHNIIQTAELPPGGGTASFSNVTPGSCHIWVEGKLDGELKSVGELTVTIKQGPNGPLTVIMGPPETKPAELGEYHIEIVMIDNQPGDSVTVTPKAGDDGTKITLNYVLANATVFNLIDFSGTVSVIPGVTAAGSGTRTYTINPSDASADNKIIIIVTFIHVL